MLNHTRNRHPLSRRARVCALATALVVAAPIAAIAITQRTVEPVTAVARTDVALVAPTAFDASEPVTPPAAPPARPHARSATRAAPAPVLAKAPAGRQQAPASISGVMSDASGAVLPGVELTLTDAASGVVYSRVSDGTGAFTFPDLPPGRYALVAALAGFAAVTVELTLAPGERVQRRLSMRIGGLVETITVGCAPEGGALPRPARGVMAFERRAAMARLVALSQDAPLAQDQPGPKPVRVGGQIRAPQKLKDVRPICPRLLLPPQEGTVVILEAVIGPDGYTHDIRPLRPQSSTEFVESAMEAVRQWQFTPTRLNNSPVPVIMTVTVLYQRM
jgi:TonB family protein